MRVTCTTKAGPSGILEGREHVTKQVIIDLLQPFDNQLTEILWDNLSEHR